jgi:hypothetical protein
MSVSKENQNGLSMNFSIIGGPFGRQINAAAARIALQST